MSSLDRILPFLRPIEDLLRDPAVTEVMVNCGGRRVFVERDGALEAGARPDARSPEPDRRDQEHRPGLRRRDLRGAAGARRAARGRLARGRDVPAVLGRRADADRPEVHAPLHACDELVERRHADAGMVAATSIDAVAQPAERPDLRRHGHRQDDAAERAGGDDSGRRPHRR